MADGHEVVSLGVGEPDFDTPDHVADAAIAAIRRHDTRYPPVAGKPELREAVAGLYDGMAAENVIVSSGSKYTILNMFLASVDPGDEIVVPTPYWGPYRDIAGRCRPARRTASSPPGRGSPPPWARRPVGCS